MAYQIDQRSIRCWVKSKLQSASILQCFLEFSRQLPLNQLNKCSEQRKLKKNTQVTSKIISFTQDVKQQLQFAYFSHLLTFKRMSSRTDASPCPGKHAIKRISDHLLL